MCQALATRGADNLIDSCLGQINGKTIGLIAERPELGWYDAAIADMLEERITDRGGICRRLASNGPANATDPRITALESEVDALVFLCRSGDQGRFERKAEGKPVVMCYARNAAMLASPFGRIPHDNMVRLKKEIDRLCMEAEQIEVTCPLGTYLVGSVAAPPHEQEGLPEVGIKRFPMSVPQPLICAGFAGKVVVRGNLTTTGSRVYEPAVLNLEDALTITLDGHVMSSIEGSKADQERFHQHYYHVAETFGLEPFYVHSFHAGIHPGLEREKVAASDADYWANTVFGSPHYLHFHTCGVTPPGEICWMIAEPTIRLDGVALWQDGLLHPMAFNDLAVVVEKSPMLQDTFSKQI